MVFVEGDGAASCTAVMIRETDAVHIGIGDAGIRTYDCSNLLRKNQIQLDQRTGYHRRHVFSFPPVGVAYSILEMGE